MVMQRFLRIQLVTNFVNSFRWVEIRHLIDDLFYLMWALTELAVVYSILDFWVSETILLV